MDADETGVTELYRRHWHLIAMLMIATLMAGFVLGWELRPILDKNVIILQPERGQRTSRSPSPT